MNEGEHREEEFPIIGNFNIPIIFPVNIVNEEMYINESLNLPPYEEGTGTASNPSSGYYIHHDLESTQFIDEHLELKDIFENLILIDFIIDNYGSRSKYRNGRIIRGEKKLLGPKVNNIFWIKPDLLIVRGSKKTAMSFQHSFKRIFRGDILLKEPYQFDPWFFIWIIYHHRTKTPEVDQNFFIDLMLEMSIEGPVVDYTGGYAQSRKSLDVSRSLIILIPLLEKKLPKEVKFGINVENSAVVIKMNINGTILVYQTRGILKNLNKFESTIFGCYIVKRIIELYNKWETLPNLEKFPPIEFIDSISQELTDKGYEITATVADTKEMYQEKRNQ